MRYIPLTVVISQFHNNAQSVQTVCLEMLEYWIFSFHIWELLQESVYLSVLCNFLSLPRPYKNCMTKGVDPLVLYGESMKLPDPFK